MQNNNTSRSQCHSTVFWGEIAPCDHVVQIYEDREAFLDILTGFVTDGIKSGDCVVLILKPDHLQALDERLMVQNYDIKQLTAQAKFIAVDAQQALSEFMIDGWPDQAKFMTFISGLLNRARKTHTQIRAFGEMVALLWEQGHYGATVNLEHLWNNLLAEQSFKLFCAYPKSGFTQNPGESILDICATHSMVIDGKKGTSEISYLKVSQTT
jgi:hypothetical protein